MRKHLFLLLFTSIGAFAQPFNWQFTNDTFGILSADNNDTFLIVLNGNRAQIIANDSLSFYGDIYLDSNNIYGVNKIVGDTACFTTYIGVSIDSAWRSIQVDSILGLSGSQDIVIFSAGILELYGTSSIQINSDNEIILNPSSGLFYITNSEPDSALATIGYVKRSVTASGVQYSDSLTVFVTPSQLSDSLSGFTPGGGAADSTYKKISVDTLQSLSSNNINVNQDNLTNVNEITADSASLNKIFATKIQFADTTISSSGTITLNCRDWNYFKVTMTGNVTLDLTNQRVGDYKILLIQDGTGNRAVTWSSTEWYAQDGLININITAGSKTLISGFYDGAIMIITEVTFLTAL